VVESVAFPDERVIFNACCLVNLCASRYFSSILEALPVPAMVAADIYQYEVLRVYSEGVGGEGLVYEPIELEPLLHTGLLVAVSPSSETEVVSVIELAATSGEDADAFTAALALSRHWAIGVDDSKAAAFFRRAAPRLQLLSTPQFVKHWAETADPSPETVRAALRNIQRYAKYAIPSQHALHGWWRSYLDN